MAAANPAIFIPTGMDAGGALSKRSDGEGHLYTSCSSEQDEAALLRANAGLVHKIVRKYYAVGLEPADLVQEGMIGLLEAIRSYDPTRGAALTTHAHWLIRKRLQRAIQNQSRQIRLPSHVWDDPELVAAAPVVSASLDAAVDAGSNDAEGGTLGEVLPDPSPSPEERALSGAIGHADLRYAVSGLPTHLFDVVVARYWHDESIVDIARRLGVPRQTVDRRERRALQLLRNVLEEVK